MSFMIVLKSFRVNPALERQWKGLASEDRIALGFFHRAYRDLPKGKADEILDNVHGDYKPFLHVVPHR